MSLSKHPAKAALNYGICQTWKDVPPDTLAEGLSATTDFTGKEYLTSVSASRISNSVNISTRRVITGFNTPMLTTKQVIAVILLERSTIQTPSQ